MARDDAQRFFALDRRVRTGRARDGAASSGGQRFGGAGFFFARDGECLCAVERVPTYG